MSRPNTSDDAQAPLLVNDHPGAEPSEQEETQDGPWTSKTVKIFSRTYTVAHLLVLFFGTLAVVAVGLAIAAIVVSVERRDNADSKPKHHKRENVCLTPECVQLSADILRSFGDADPCEDFYDYACGGWEKRVEIPSDRSRYGTIDEVSEANDRILRDIFTGSYPSATPNGELPDVTEAVDVQNFEKLQNAYNACLNETIIDDRGAKPLLHILENVIAKYPVDSKCNPMKFQNSVDEVGSVEDKERCSEVEGSLTEVIEYLQSIGVGALFSLVVGEDSKNTTVNIMSLYQDGSGLPSKTHYTQEDTLKKYEKTIEESFTAVFGEGNTTKFKDFSKKIVAFEKTLKESEMDPEDIQDEIKTYNPVPVSNLTATFPYVSFETIIPHLTGKSLPKKVLLTSPPYLEAVNTLVSKTPKDILQAYFLWVTIRRYITHTSLATRKPYEDFRKVLAGIDPAVKQDRWKTCVREMDGMLGFIAGEFYVRKQFAGDAKERGKLIIEQIKDAFVDRFAELEWVDNTTRAVAVSKVKNLRVKVGYNDASPNISDPVDLAKWYGKVTIKKDTYFENFFSFILWVTGKELSSVGEPVDKDRWLMTPQTWNAYYNPPGNEIVFPAGILQAPTFFPWGKNPNYLNYLNLGAFGAVAGHEISHAFDQNGRHYNENGTLTDWWSEATVKGFEEREVCFVDEYASFTIKAPNGTDVHLNGRLTEGENIADNGGLRAAWNAWHKERKKLSKKEKTRLEPKLPGLDLTPEQLFFLSFARTWCTKTRPESLLVQVLTNPHSPGPFRTLGTLQNSPEFVEAFKCSGHSKMNVKDKCTLW